MILFEKHNLPFCLCMDNWLLSGDLKHQPDPNHELMIASKLIGWASVKKSLLHSAKAAFSPNIDDKWLENYEQKLTDLFEKWI